jgi:type II secretory pathway component PulK
LWNFHGEVFTLANGVKITIQDQNSLVSLFKGQGKNTITKLINSFNIPNVKPDVVRSSLIDWQDEDDLVLVNGAEANYYNKVGLPTNMPLQSMSELTQIKGFTPALITALKPYVTIRAQEYFNPLNAPKRVLALFVDNLTLEKVIELRHNRELTSSEFQRITRIEEDETIGFSLSGALKVKLQVSYNEILLIKESEFLIKPYEHQPYIEYQ